MIINIGLVGGDEAERISFARLLNDNLPNFSLFEVYRRYLSFEASEEVHTNTAFNQILFDSMVTHDSIKRLELIYKPVQVIIQRDTIFDLSIESSEMRPVLEETAEAYLAHYPFHFLFLVSGENEEYWSNRNDYGQTATKLALESKDALWTVEKVVESLGMGAVSENSGDSA